MKAPGRAFSHRPRRVRSALGARASSARIPCRGVSRGPGGRSPKGCGREHSGVFTCSHTSSRSHGGAAFRTSRSGAKMTTAARAPRRAVPPGGAAALVDLCRRWPQRPAMVLQVGLEQASWARAGAVVWWMTGRDAGIACDGPPGGPESSCALGVSAPTAAGRPPSGAGDRAGRSSCTASAACGLPETDGAEAPCGLVISRVSVSTCAWTTRSRV